MIENGIELSEKEIARFEKAYNKALEKGKSKIDAVLKAEAQAAKNRIRAIYPKGKTGNLRKGLRVLQPKGYGENNGIRVARVNSVAPHSHLIEYGHNIVTTRASRAGAGYKVGKTSRMSMAKKMALGVKSGGFVEGKYYFQKGIEEINKAFAKKVDKVITDMCKEMSD